MENEVTSVSDLLVNADADTTKAEVKKLKLDLLTKPPLLGMVVSISSSEADDLPQLGLSELHLNDLLIEINRYLLAGGTSLAYGGDLRDNGITKMMMELVSRYKFSTEDQSKRLRSYLAWPLSLHLTQEMEAEYVKRVMFIRVDPPSDLELADKNVFLPPTGSQNLYVWARSLTTMREMVSEACDAAVFIGGRAKGYKGKAPGVFEELSIWLIRDKPVFLIGAFGGISGLVSSYLNGDRRLEDLINNIVSSPAHAQLATEYQKHGRLDENNWPVKWIEILSSGWSAISKKNCLSVEENIRLASTRHVPEIIYYLLKGLALIQKSKLSD